MNASDSPRLNKPLLLRLYKKIKYGKPNIIWYQTNKSKQQET